jgi:hypothetical protein
MGCLRNLRAVAREHLILVSMVVPEEISTPHGDTFLRGGRTMFVPAITENERTILHAHFESVGVKVHSINGPEVERWTREDGTPFFGPWWWTFTPSLLRSMIGIAGFEVVTDAPVARGRSHGFVCRRR